MSDKQKTRKRDDPEESKRFIEMAKKVEADETPEAFDRAFKRVVRKPSPQPPARRR